MEFWRFYGIVRKRLWMVVFLVLVTVSSTIATVMMQPPHYQAVATVRVALNSPSVANIGQLDWFTSSILFADIQETIVSRSVLQQIIDQDRLGMKPEDLRKAISVSRVGGSDLISIQVDATDPSMAKRIANDLTVAFIRYNQKQLDTQTASSIAFFEEQVKQAQQNYNKARDNFQQSLQTPNERAAETQYISAQTAYQDAQDKLEGAQLINRFPDLRPASVAIFEPAVTPDQPASRQLARYGVISLLVALLLGVSIAMGIEYLDLSIKSPQEISSELGLTVLGFVPHFSRGIAGTANVVANLDLPILSRFVRWQISRLESRILPPDQLPLEARESFRRTRVRLVAVHQGRAQNRRIGASTLLVASSRPRDGKTTVTAQLGISLSQAGHRVLLIDADFRRPELHLHVGVSGKGPGLSEVLEEKSSVEEAIKATPYARLALIPAGADAAAKPDLLDSQQVSDLLAQLSTNYDFILVDSPSLGLYSDAATLASRLGHVLLVVDAARPNFESESRSLALLTSTGATIDGVIVNKINHDYVNPTKLHSLPRVLGPIHTNGHVTTPEIDPVHRVN